MDSAFGEQYASLYDVLYEDKDYERECDLVTGILGGGSRTARRILDLGCGTGGHSVLLAQQGYSVVGVDISASMLDIAREKASTAGLTSEQASFIHADMRDMDVPGRFDACICMFAALGYQQSNEGVEAAIASIRKHLEPGALFIFDCWYGPAVLSVLPSQRVKEISQGEATIIRVATPDLDLRHHVSTTTYTILVVEGDQVLRHFKEPHTMRFFFPMELEYFLRKGGFRLTSLTDFNDLSHQADETTWNVTVVAEAT
ncbi:MAG: SAM-dependent methyltransferase [Chloroflexi bacterium]|jgi:SAM-dependent methyltransferase|nr:MAG: SAM-dependent methyltransferase [Chloroflexota bacterium]